MKKIFLGLTLILGASVITANAQTGVQSTSAKSTTAAPAGSAAVAAISFKEPENTYDFGSVPQGTPVSHNFTFTNTGKAPLVLSAVNTTCGCTVPEWPKEALKPGGSAVIKVTYNAAATGTFTRAITVVSNAAATPQTVLNIKGEVKAVQTQTNAQPATPVQSTAPKKSK